MFERVSTFTPAGDQPKAIELLARGINQGAPSQVLLGVTELNILSPELWNCGIVGIIWYALDITNKKVDTF